MSDKISRKSASISTIPDAEITIPDAKINTWYKDGDRRWRVLERETNWEQIDLIPSPIKAGIPGATSEIPSQADPEGSGSVGNPKNEEDAVNHGKSGGSLRSQSGRLKEGPVGLEKSGGSQGPGQNGSQTNENDEKKSIQKNPSPSENSGGNPKNEEDSVSHGKSGGSLKSQTGTPQGNGIQINENIYESPNLSEYPGAGSGGSVGHGKSGGSQGSGQNENIYESLPLAGNPGNDAELKEDDISHGHPGGQPLSEDSGNATKLKGGAGRKKKSGFWNCCSGGSTGSGYPYEDENAINENHENDIELKEGSQGSGQNGNQTNKNIYESLPLPGNPGNDKELKEDAISHGHLGGHGKSGVSQGYGQNGIQIDENIYESPACVDIPGAGNQGSVCHGKSGDSQGSGQNGNQKNGNDEEKPILEITSLPEDQGAGSGGSVGHEKPGGFQGSGQNGSQTNENIYESPPLPGIPGNATELKGDAISHGHPGGQPEEKLPLPEDSRNATKLKKSAGSKKKSGFWNCCSGGSTGSGHPSEDRESLALSENHENTIKLKPGDVIPQTGGENGSSSLDKSGAAVKGAPDESRSISGYRLPYLAGSQGKFGLYERSRSITGSLSNEMTTEGLISAKTLAENAGCLRGMEISMECGSLPYRERREVHWIEQINKAKEEIQACLPLSETSTTETDQDGSNFGFSVMIPSIAIGGILLLLAVGFALYLHFIGITDMYSD